MRKGFDKHIRLSKEELNELRRKAQASCLNESALIRHLIMGFTPKEKPDDRFYDVMRELSAIEEEYPQLLKNDSPTHRVGGAPQKKFEQSKHLLRR